MSWAELQRNWASVVDVIALHFPHTDRLELLKIEGDLTSFAQYLADVHDLTFKEALDAVDFVLLRKRPNHRRQDQAA